MTYAWYAVAIQVRKPERPTVRRNWIPHIAGSGDKKKLTSHHAYIITTYYGICQDPICLFRDIIIVDVDMKSADRVMKEVMRNVRDARKRANPTQADVADKLNLRTQTYNGYETPARFMSISHLLALPAILNCRITDLLSDSVVTDYDRERARDDKLDFLINNWDDISDDAKDATVFVASGGIEKKT